MTAVVHFFETDRGPAKYDYNSLANIPPKSELIGPKGDDGKDGVDGKDGKDGKDGIDGKDGKDGTPVTFKMSPASKTDEHPNGGIELTVSDADHTAVTNIWNGNDGESYPKFDDDDIYKYIDDMFVETMTVAAPGAQTLPYLEISDEEQERLNKLSDAEEYGVEV